MSQASSPSNSTDRAFMQLAIEEMQKSEGRGPKVGAVIVSGGQVVTVGHCANGVHAERAAIEAAQSQRIDFRGATLYSTLEPCISTGSAIEACSPLIARVGIYSVYIGRYDTNPLIYREGWKVLRDAGVVLRDFDAEMRAKIDAINAQFADHFVLGTGPTGGARFDYLLNGGNFEIQYSEADKSSFLTRWNLCGRDAIYAYAVQPVRVALARHANSFSEIDDPKAFNFSYTTRVGVGEIAVFVSDTGVALVKVVEVHSGPEYGSDHISVKIEYNVRAWDDS